MATVNFSIPAAVKAEFNQLFANENKSAVLTGLIQEAIERKKVKQRRLQAMESILELRARQAPVNGAEIAKAKQEIRS